MLIIAIVLLWAFLSMSTVRKI